MPKIFDEPPDIFDDEGQVLEIDYKFLPDPLLSLAFAEDVLLLKFYRTFQQGIGRYEMNAVFALMEDLES